MEHSEPKSSLSSFRYLLSVVFFLAAFLSAKAFSQTDESTVLKGRVLDPQGNSLPGARVTVSVHNAAGDGQLIGTTRNRCREHWPRDC